MDSVKAQLRRKSFGISKTASIIRLSGRHEKDDGLDSLYEELEVDFGIKKSLAENIRERIFVVKIQIE